MARPHPLLHVDDVFDLALLRSGLVGILLEKSLWLFVAFEVRPEMLQEGDLLLELLRVLGQCEFLTDILPVY